MAVDNWHFPRTPLASHVLGMFETGLSSALTFFAPRRMGKTEFLRKDMAPLAETQGWRVFYFSFLDADAGVSTAFTNDLDAFSRGDGWMQRAGKALGRIGKVSGSVAGVGADVELKDKADGAEIKAVIARLAASHDKVLLLLDEVQALAAPGHQPFVAALRTALDMHKDRVKVIFTGSSREGLRRMFSQASAPFFHFGQNLPFPDLGREFTDHLANTFATATGRTLDKETLWQAFIDMGHVPQLTRSLVERMALSPSLDMNSAKTALVKEIDQDRDYANEWEKCSALERLLLQKIAAGARELYGMAAREALAQRLGIPEVAVPSVQSALRTLGRRSLVFKAAGRREYEIEDPMFREWILAEKSP